jgi:very-short-patch-repair endonuclease
VNIAVEFVRTIETTDAEAAPTLTLPRKRERECTALRAGDFPCDPSVSSEHRAAIRLSILHSAPPLPLAGEGWGGGAAASEVAMEDEKPSWKVSSKLRSNARALRRNSTDAERILWLKLRDHRLNGASFRRQVPIKNYIADFVCHAARLVIELDGGQHFSDEAERADAARSTAIEARGFTILRFSNHEVMTNRAGMLESIAAAIAASAPTPSVPRKRRREDNHSPARKRSS